MKSKLFSFELLLLLILFTFSSSCKNWSCTAKGGVIGAGTRGVVGGIIGRAAGNTPVGAIIGSALGGSAGAAIGRYMDKQAEEIKRDLKDAKVERIGEGIKITFPAGILFDVNSYELKPEAKKNIEDLSKTLKKYNNTNILVEGQLIIQEQKSTIKNYQKKEQKR